MEGRDVPPLTKLEYLVSINMAEPCNGLPRLLPAVSIPILHISIHLDLLHTPLDVRKLII